MRQRSRQAQNRPAKPYPDFPLFPHATGRWAKKIRGRFAFFGPWRDPNGALDKYLAERDDLQAGRVPRVRRDVGPGWAGAARAGTGANGGTGGGVADVAGTVRGRRSGPATGGITSYATTNDGLELRDLVNGFLNAKTRRLEAGEMGRRSFADYCATVRRLVEAFGAHRLVDDILPEDFGMLRATMAKVRGAVALGNEIGRVRSIFKFGYDAGLLDRPARFGPEFAKPPKRAMRAAKQAQGMRMFEPREIHKLLKAASPQLAAMILLGVNCGMGNTDVADLPRTALDLKNGVLEFPRPKTSIRRRAVLWPETVKAIKESLKVRPKPKVEADEGLVFVTKYGHRWVRVEEPGSRSKGRTQAVVKDGVVQEFGKLMRETKTHLPGRGFYGLRHSFRTVADEVGDRRAVDLVMGHENGGDIATHYVEKISDERLRKVSKHVRGWLCDGPTAKRGVRSSASGSRDKADRR